MNKIKFTRKNQYQTSMSNDFESILKKINETPALLLYCSFPDCQVCKTLRPKVENLLKNYPAVNFLFLNVEEYPIIKGQYLVFTVPTLIVFVLGKEVKRFSRFFSLDELKEILERSLTQM